MNFRLKRGLTIQSLSMVFILLVIRHFHCEFFDLVSRFVSTMNKEPFRAIEKAVCHELFGESIVSLIGVVWVVLSLLYIPAFSGTQEAGFHSHGEQIILVEEKKDVFASFLMTFLLPLLIDELTTPQYWISYLLVIVVVYAVMEQSDLFYQSPVLALLKYHVYGFRVVNPDETDLNGFSIEKTYVGITRETEITDNNTIKWKRIVNNVYLIYCEK